MKKLIFSMSSCCLFQIAMMAQTPQQPLILGAFSMSSGTFLKQNANMITSVEEAVNDANVTYKAGNTIKLLPGFTVNGLSTQGKFHAILESDYEIVSMHTNGWSIPKYDKFELGIKLPQALQSQVNDFFTSNGTSGVNPYDADKLQIKFFFSINGTQYQRNAFYFRDFTVSNNYWQEATTPYTMRVRFAPPQTGAGAFHYEVWLNGVLQSPNAYSNAGSFNVISSNNHGHLTTANNLNTRKFFFEDGTPFFGIGQNLWAGGDGGANGCLSYQCVSPFTYNKLRDWINNLADNGGNFTRLRIDNNQFPIMWPNQQFQTGDPPPDLDLSKYLINYDNNQKHMWELDKTFNLMEDRGIYAILCLLQDQNYTIDNPYGNPTWTSNPYSALLGQGVTNCKTFFSDNTSRKIFKKYLDYVISRWGYSTNLGGWMMINETKNVADKATSFDSNGNITSTLDSYGTDLAFRLQVDQWICYMKTHMEQQYPWHPTTTGLTGFDIIGSGAYNFRNISCLDFWSQNSYDIYNEGNKYILKDWNRVETMVKVYWNNNRPFIWGEIGMVDPCADIDKYNDRTFHNANWISVVSGAIGTGMYWQDMEQIHGIDHRANFNAIKAFAADVDWTKLWIPIVGTYTDRLGTIAGGNGKSVYTFNSITLDGKNAIAFSLNNSSNWTNDPPSSFGNSANYFGLLQKQNILQSNVFAYDIDPSQAPVNPPVIIKGILGTSNSGIEPHKVYKYKTYGSGGLISSSIQYSGYSSLQFYEDMPFAIGANGNYPDYAYIVKPFGAFRTSDTLTFNNNDTVYLNPYFIENKNDYTYTYDWGNGIVTHDTCVNVHYSEASTYTITLTLNDTKADTSSSYLQVVKVNSINEILNKTQILLYPNPAFNTCFIKYDLDLFYHPNIEIYDQLGKLVLKEQLNNNEINISVLANGMYFVKFFGIGYQKNCKLIKH